MVNRQDCLPLELEKETRRLRRYVLGLMLIASLLLLREARAFSAPGVVEGQRFVLRDAGGRPRAVLSVDEDGVGRLTFYRSDGSKAMSLSEKPEMVPVR